MTYTKPEISMLGDAVGVIQGQPKQPCGLLETSVLWGFVPAYELDE